MNGYFIQILLLISLTHITITLGNHVHDVEKELRLQEIEQRARLTRSGNFAGLTNEQGHTEYKRLSFMVAGRNLDGGENKVSPRVSLYYQTQGSDLNRQEAPPILQNGNPDWQTIFTYSWVKGTGQKWEFKVKGTNAAHPDTEVALGHAQVDVDTYVKNKENILVDLEGGQGQLVIEKTTPIRFKLGANNLAKRDTFGGKSDPYVKCYWRRGPDGTDELFAKSSIVNNVVDVEWMDNLVFNGYQKGTDQYMHFMLYDDDGITSDDFLGEAFLKLDAATEAEPPFIKVIDLMNEGKRKSGRGNIVVRISDTNKNQVIGDGDIDPAF